MTEFTNFIADFETKQSPVDYYYPSYFLLWVVVLKNYDANISRFITDKK